MRIIITITLLCTIIATLLNGNAFGSSSLIAYFTFSIFATFFSILVFSQLLFSKNSKFVFPLSHTLLFLLLCSYVFIHGYKTNTIGLTHYYWFVIGIFTLALSFLINSHAPEKTKGLIKNINRLIVIIAIIEALIVILQLIKIIPSLNSFFKCTGSWVNPNVTAMFLVVTMLPAIQVRKQNLFNNRYIELTSIAIILFAIAALACRTAYIAILLILLINYGIKFIFTFYKSRLKENIKGVGLAIVTIFTLLMIFTSFKNKVASTSNRISILKTSISLLDNKPIEGIGFGMFEKEYNLFSVQANKPNNAHINMPYNDFLEIAIEGGYLAALIWVLFLSSVLLFARKNNNKILTSLIFAVIAMQCTNFYFNAIPAFVLFIIVMLFQSAKDNKIATIGSMQKNVNRLILLTGLLLSFLLFLNATKLTSAFQQKWKFTQQPVTESSIQKLFQLNTVLKGYSSYHQTLADYLASQKKYQFAIEQYNKALIKSSEPELFSKKAYCYQMLLQYDSSEYYFKRVEKIETEKLIPKLALLKLYEQKKDTQNIVIKAKEILNKPIKIKTLQALKIKKYADSVLNINSKTSSQ